MFYMSVWRATDSVM